MRNGSKSRKYYVIFQKSNLNHWFMRLLKPEFRHVLVACKSEGGYFWVVIDPKGGNIFADIHPSNEPIRNFFPDDIILEMWSKAHPEPKTRIWLISCTEIVKKVLGIREFFVLTPYQLYKHIKGEIKNGKRRS